MLAGALAQTRAYTGCISVQTVANRHSNAVLVVEERASDERKQADMAWLVEAGLFDALARCVTGPVSQTTCETGQSESVFCLCQEWHINAGSWLRPPRRRHQEFVVLRAEHWAQLFGKR